LKGVAVGEILLLVPVRFPQKAVIDEIEDELAKVFRPGDAPLGKDGTGDGAEFLEGVAADALQEFLPGDMPGRPLIRFFQVLDGEIQGVAQEKVRIARIADPP